MDARSILRAQDASRQNLVERDSRRRAVLTNTYTGALTTTDLRVNGLADQKPVIDVGWTVPAESLNPRVDFWSNANLIASKMKSVIRSQVTGIDSRGPTPTAAASALIAAEARTHEPVFAMKPQILNGRSTTGALGLPSAKMAILSLADPRVPETLPFLQSIVDQLIAKYQAALNSSSSVLHASRQMQALAVQLGCSREIALRASRAITRSYFPGQDIESKEEREEADRAKQEQDRAVAEEQREAVVTQKYNVEKQSEAEAEASNAATEKEKQEDFEDRVEYYNESYDKVVGFWAEAKAKAFGAEDGEIGAPPESYKASDNIMFAYYMLHSGLFWFVGTPEAKLQAMVGKLKVLIGYFNETATSGGEQWKVRKDRQAHQDVFIKSVMKVLQTEAAALKANNNRTIVVEAPRSNAADDDFSSFIFHNEALEPTNVQSLRDATDMMEVEPAGAATTAASSTETTDTPVEEAPMSEDAPSTKATNPVMAKKATAQTPVGSKVGVKTITAEEIAAKVKAGRKVAAKRKRDMKLNARSQAEAPPLPARSDEDEMAGFVDAEDGGMEGTGGARSKHTKRRKLKGGANEENSMTIADAAAAERQETATTTETKEAAAPAAKATAETSTSTDGVTPVVFQSTEASTSIATPLPAEPVVPPVEDPAGKVPSTGQSPVVQKKKVQSKLPQGTVTAPRTSRDTYTPGTDMPRPLVPPTQWTAVQKTKAPKTELERRLA